MRVVIDTNVVVSAVLKANGPEAKVLFAVSDAKLNWCVSAPILREYAG
jgi:putative PIN family toxin of toxin-antitoxin system